MSGGEGGVQWLFGQCPNEQRFSFGGASLTCEQPLKLPSFGFIDLTIIENFRDMAQAVAMVTVSGKMANVTMVIHHS